MSVRDRVDEWIKVKRRQIRILRLDEYHIRRVIPANNRGFIFTSNKTFTRQNFAVLYCTVGRAQQCNEGSGFHITTISRAQIFLTTANRHESFL